MELEVKANTLVASERLSYHLRCHVTTAWQIDYSGESGQNSLKISKIYDLFSLGNVA